LILGLKSRFDLVLSLAPLPAMFCITSAGESDNSPKQPYQQPYPSPHRCHTESLSTSDDEEQETTTALPFLLRRSATMPLPQSTTRSKAALNRQRSLHSPGIISPRYGLLAAALVSRCEHEVDSRQNHSNAKQTSPSSLFFLT